MFAFNYFNKLGGGGVGLVFVSKANQSARGYVKLGVNDLNFFFGNLRFIILFAYKRNAEPCLNKLVLKNVIVKLIFGVKRYIF